MKTTPLLGLVVLAAVVATPARATVINAVFTGTVTSQTGTATAIGAAVTGQFTYDTATSAFSGFTIAGVPVSAGFASTASFTPDQLTALYKAQISPVSQGGTVNNTFFLDLEGITKFPAGGAVALLTNAAQLATNLDLANDPASVSPSTFGYYLGNSDGTNVRQVSADLTGISATVVPEPATLAVLGVAVFGFGVLRRRA